jgi:hypothetical protein
LDIEKVIQLADVINVKHSKMLQFSINSVFFCISLL